ncbi:hypothetical protein PENTCL1PPCAC_22170, partial [Pristionchus entomophagus]
FFISLFFGVNSHEVYVDKDYSWDGTIVHSSVLFVPLGFDATINCDALDLLSSVHVDPAKVHWRRLTDAGTVVVPYSVPGAKSTERFYSTSHEVLYVFGVQEGHNNTVVECHVEHEEENPQKLDVTLTQNVAGMKADSKSSFDIKERRSRFVSRTKIVVQDCGEDDERKSINELNPCMYGVCLIDNSTSFHRLQCMCVEQYTGEYCDVLVSGTFWREFLFYSPVLAHLAFVALFTFHQCCVARTRKVRKTALEDVLDKSHADRIDMKKLYPAVYYDATDLEQMTQSEEDEKHDDKGNGNDKKKN